MKIYELQSALDEYLKSDAIKDSSLNGLQVGDRNEEVNKIAFAVDVSEKAILAAVDGSANALIVHHGLFWSKVLPVSGSLYKRLKLLIENSIALFAYHLPLDMHPESGNNIEIARLLDLENIIPFGIYNGDKIGFKGVFRTPVTVDDIIKKLPAEIHEYCRVLKHGPEKIKSIGIVSGGAASEVSDAIEEGLDCYLTGESSHGIFHDVLENRINVIFAGHYFTEIYGVKALQKWVKEKFGIATMFFDYPTYL